VGKEEQNSKGERGFLPGERIEVKWAKNESLKMGKKKGWWRLIAEELSEVFVFPNFPR
jgi:hypothetical protein